MSLRSRATEMNSGKGIEFMSDRVKGDVKSLNGDPVVVRDYAFLHGDDGDYVVFIIDEDPNCFYFGATVMTENFKEFTEFEKKEVQRDGLPVRFSDRKNRKGNRTYQAIEFYPECEIANGSAVDPDPEIFVPVTDDEAIPF